MFFYLTVFGSYHTKSSDVERSGLNRVLRSGPGISQYPVHNFFAGPDRPVLGPDYPGFLNRVTRGFEPGLDRVTRSKRA